MGKNTVCDLLNTFSHGPLNNNQALCRCSLQKGFLSYWESLQESLQGGMKRRLTLRRVMGCPSTKLMVRTSLVVSWGTLLGTCTPFMVLCKAKQRISADLNSASNGSPMILEKKHCCMRWPQRSLRKIYSDWYDN